ncbi:unnamed protein product [Moneuplotes crassus]|uniref:Transmembrane protein n=1 Tax=Euplotes crassus TaxID=5936 RepID=A0AAD2CXY7_EUPCR|nr:unnamed protein product [Moneuplotes crassus]
MLSTNNNSGNQALKEENPDQSSVPQKSFVENYLYGKTKFCKHQHSCFKESLKTFVKLFLSGLGVKIGLGFLLGLLKTRNISKTVRNVISWDPVRFAAFVGLLPALFKIALCILRHYRNKDDKLNVLIAAIFCSFSALADNSDDRRKILIYYIFSRAFESFIEMVRSHEVAPVPSNWGLCLGIFCTNFLSYMIFFHGELVPKGLYRMGTTGVGFKGNEMKLIEVVYRGIGNKP